MPANRPYSIRDLRSLFVADQLRGDLGGDYDYASRRWYFASRDDRAAAVRLLAARGPLETIHDPDAIGHEAIIKRYEGFAVLPRTEAGALRRSTATWIFPSHDLRFAAERALYPKTRATTPVAAVAAKLNALDCGDLPSATLRLVDTWKAGDLPSQSAADELEARLQALSARPAPTREELRVSRNDAYQSALGALGETGPDHLLDAPCDGRLVGTVLARTTHHLAVYDEEQNALTLVARRRLRMPLRQQYRRERAIERYATIGIDFAQGFGAGMQFDERGGSLADRDHAFTQLRMRAWMAARERAPELYMVTVFEQLDRREDFEGELLTSADGVAAALDKGAVIGLGYASLVVEGVLRTGPSFPQPPRSLARAM